MGEAFEAIGEAIKLCLMVVVYAIIMIPLGIACFLASFLLIPLDLIVLVFSFGQVKFSVLRAFQTAAAKCFAWFAENAQ